MINSSHHYDLDIDRGIPPLPAAFQVNCIVWQPVLHSIALLPENLQKLYEMIKNHPEINKNNLKPQQKT
jgi:hypothetical protein